MNWIRSCVTLLNTYATYSEFYSCYSYVKRKLCFKNVETVWDAVIITTLGSVVVCIIVCIWLIYIFWIQNERALYVDKIQTRETPYLLQPIFLFGLTGYLKIGKRIYIQVKSKIIPAKKISF